MLRRAQLHTKQRLNDDKDFGGCQVQRAIFASNPKTRRPPEGGTTNGYGLKPLSLLLSVVILLLLLEAAALAQDKLLTVDAIYDSETAVNGQQLVLSQGRC